MTGISLLPPALAGLAALWLLPVPPGLVLLGGGLLLPLVGDGARRGLVLGLPLLVLLLVWRVPDGVVLSLPFLDWTLEPLKGGAAGRLFATAFAIAAFAGGVFGLYQARTLELAAAFVYAGSAIMVTLAGDLLTLFIFWEVMAVGSTLVVWSADGPRARAAGLRYALVHLLGGVLLMAGIAGQVAASGSTAFVPMALAGPAQWLILAGFLVNAGAPPLSAWLPDAYPEASPSGMVFLSAFTTKTAVYALWVGFPGAGVLVAMGLVMVFYGILYALLETDYRRLLAYSIISQVGFMVTAIGIGTELALNGAVAHAFAHILYKALLLMSAGAVLYRTGRRDWRELGGLARTMPVTAACAVVGALSISAFPLTSGFVSKSLVVQAAAEAGLLLPWLLLTAASAAAFLYVGLRYPWLVFLGRDAGTGASEAPGHMQASMLLLAVLCVLLGLVPALWFAALPFPVTQSPYTAAHVVAQLQLLLFAGLGFALLAAFLPRQGAISLEVDWLYRRCGLQLSKNLTAVLLGLTERLGNTLHAARSYLLRKLARHRGPYGELARVWPTGSMVLWVAVLLITCLVFYYL